MRDNPLDGDYIGIVAFAQEMQNNPLDESQQLIRDEWVQPYSLSGLINHFAPLARGNDILGEFLAHYFDRVVAAVDPAISEKETADFWAMVTVGFAKACPICEGAPAGHIFVLDYERMRDADPNNQVNIVIESYETWQPDKVRIEAVAYQAGLVKLIKREAAARGIYLPLKGYRPLTSKVRRMSVQAANFSGGMVHVRSDSPLYQAFRDELLEFPQGEHDDMVDAYLSAAEGSMKRRGFVGTKDDV